MGGVSKLNGHYSETHLYIRNTEVDVREVGSNVYRVSHSKHSTTIKCTINIVFIILMIGTGV